MARRGGHQGGRPGSRRHSQRGRSHAQAHLDAVDQRPPDVPDHPLIPQGDPQMIVDESALAELIDHVRQVGRFAYDTEFIGELSYFPQICLVQIATGDRLVLIDPLAQIDLTPVWELIADAEVETIVHAGLQDLEPVLRHLGRPPRNVFDTQVAAGFVGLPHPVGLGKLIHSMIDVKLGKGFTFTHWDERPLSPLHQRYAADDVRYLLAVHGMLVERLTAADTLAYAAEQCAELESPALYEADADTLLARVRGANGLKPKQLAILRELVVWRDRAAREHDLPPRTFLKDDVLTRLARETIRNEEGLRAVRGLPRPVVEACTTQILKAIETGTDVPSGDRPRKTRVEESPDDRVTIDAVHTLASALCMGRGIDPGLVASRSDIAHWYLARQKRANAAEDMPLMQGWRGDVLGKPLVALLEGTASVEMRWRDGMLTAGVRKLDYDT